MPQKLDLKTHSKELWRSLIVALSFLCFGAAVVLPGASLLDIQVRIQKQFSETSRIITIRSAGYFIGAVLVGLVEPYVNHYLAMGLASFIAGAFLLMLPLFENIVLSLTSAGLFGFGLSVLDLVGHIIMMKLWKEKSAAFIQGLRIAFGIGAFAGPMIVRPFMLPLPNDLQDGDDVDIKSIGFHPDDVTVYWAFLIVACPTMIIGISYFWCFLEDRKVLKVMSEEEKKGIENPNKQYSTLRKYLACSILAVTFHLGFGIGTSISSFTSAFGVKSALRMDKKSTAVLLSAFWIAGIAGRILSIIFSPIFGEKLILQVGLTLVAIGDVIMIFFSYKAEACLWASYLLYSFGVSPVYSISLASISKYFVMDGRQTSFVFLCGILGEAIHPSVIGQFMDHNPVIFAYYIGTLTAILFVTMVFLQFALKKLFGEPIIESEKIDPNKRHSSFAARSLNSLNISGSGQRRASVLSVQM